MKQETFEGLLKKQFFFTPERWLALRVVMDRMKMETPSFCLAALITRAYKDQNLKPYTRQEQVL